MSLATFFMWILSILGISNGPCASATSPGPSLSVVEGGPVDDISNGF